MTFNHGSVNIVKQGTGKTLLFFWAVNGTAAWHEEIVADGVPPTRRRR
jgi:hypothetical protein